MNQLWVNLEMLWLWIATDAYREPVKDSFLTLIFIQVESFDDIINNNPIEAFQTVSLTALVQTRKEGLSLLTSANSS